MALLLLREMRELMDEQQAPCVSILFPTIKAGADSAQNAIRFKNMYRRALEELPKNWLSKIETYDFLQPARRFLEDTLFWQDQSEAFGLFLSKSLFRTYRFPQRLSESFSISDHFYTKPILPFFFEDGRFYILAASQKNIRLFQCARHGVRQINLIDVPQDIDELLRLYTTERHVEWHTLSAARPSQRGQAYYHGQSTASIHADDKILQFFYAVNQGIARMLSDEMVPMIFAGVEYLFPIYQKSNTYPALFGQCISGNPERTSGERLHAKALGLLEHWFTSAKEQMLAKFNQFVGTGHASSDSREVISAALTGRVDTLFLVRDLRLFGSYDRKTAAFEIHDSKEPGDVDLGDIIAAQTFLSRAKVYQVEPDDLPQKAPLAAIYRWPYPNEK